MIHIQFVLRPTNNLVNIVFSFTAIYLLVCRWLQMMQNVRNHAKFMLEVDRGTTLCYNSHASFICHSVAHNRGIGINLIYLGPFPPVSFPFISFPFLNFLPIFPFLLFSFFSFLLLSSEMEPGLRVSDFGWVGSDHGSVCQTRCLTSYRGVVSTE